MTDLHQAIEKCDLEGLEVALESGTDVNQPGHCGATPLIAAIRQKHEAAFELLLRHGADPDRTDDFNDTALHAAAVYDWPYAVARLIALGMDLGRHPKYPLKEIDFDVTGIIGAMGPIPMPPEMAGLMEEKDWQSLVSKTAEDSALSGKNPQPVPVIKQAESLEVLQLLLDAGESLEEADAGLRRRYIGLPAEAPLECSKASYLADRYPRFGTANPQRVESDYLQAMVRCGGNAYVARQKFDDDDLSRSVWCYDRFGHSLTPLPDGRFVGIAGEHEDSYDPDFTIYNDLFIHDGHGNVQIYRYPEDVFPPTDFHTATLVGNRIIIIGSLGYHAQRRPGETPVHAVDLSTLAISRLPTSGAMPGWISKHQARLSPDGTTIMVRQGQIWQATADGEGQMADNEREYRLDLDRLCWELGG